jgi:signal transduction histidine kinase
MESESKQPGRFIQRSHQNSTVQPLAGATGFQSFQAYLESHLQRNISFFATVAAWLTLGGIAVDWLFMPFEVVSKQLWYYSWCLFVFLGLIYIRYSSKKVQSQFSAHTSMRALIFGVGSIIWIGSLINLNYIQAAFVPMFMMGMAFFVPDKRDYFFFALANISTYFVGRITQHWNDLSDEKWIAIDCIIVFIGVILYPFVSSRLKHYHEIYELLNQLEDQKMKSFYASKMSALGEMAAGIAHEINNPLLVVNGFAFQIGIYLNSNDVDKMKKIKNASDNIANTVTRISKIITALRSFSRDANNDPFEKVKLSQLVEDTLEISRSRLAQEKIQILFDGNQLQKDIECRPAALVQVFVNLVSNSIDAIKDQPDRWIRIDVVNNLNEVEIRFTDSGPGIPQDVAEKIMQPFFTTKEIGQGTGLGLSVSHGLIEAHHGDLFYDSKAVNTSFVVRLPVQQVVRIQPKQIISA